MRLMLPRLIISYSVLDSISTVLDATPENLETGLTLFGAHHEGCHVALHAVGPGEEAIHQRTFHKPDIEHLNREFERLTSDEPSLEWIGSLHVHPLGITELSDHDLRTVREILREDAPDLPDFVAGIIQRCDDYFAVYPYLMMADDLHPWPIALEVVDDSSALLQGARERARRGAFLVAAGVGRCAS